MIRDSAVPLRRQEDRPLGGHRSATTSSPRPGQGWWSSACTGSCERTMGGLALGHLEHRAAMEEVSRASGAPGAPTAPSNPCIGNQIYPQRRCGARKRATCRDHHGRACRRARTSELNAVCDVASIDDVVEEAWRPLRHRWRERSWTTTVWSPRPCRLRQPPPGAGAAASPPSIVEPRHGGRPQHPPRQAGHASCSDTLEPAFADLTRGERAGQGSAGASMCSMSGLDDERVAPAAGPLPASMQAARSMLRRRMSMSARVAGADGYFPIVQGKLLTST